MKILRPTILVLTLTLFASTASAGNIGGMRTSGNIGGLRASGNIGGLRTSGNIGGMRGAAQTAPQSNSSVLIPATSRLDTETTISGTFAALIRMLLENGALF